MSNPLKIDREASYFNRSFQMKNIACYEQDLRGPFLIHA